MNLRAAFLVTLLVAPAAYAQTPSKNPRLAALVLAPRPPLKHAPSSTSATTPTCRILRPTYARPTDPFPACQPSEHEVTCSSSGGSGWVSGRNYGQRDQCGSCGGRGKTTSKY